MFAEPPALQASTRDGNRVVEPLAQHLAWGQFGQGLGDVDASTTQVQVLDRLLLFAGAQDDPGVGILAGRALVAVEPAQVEIDLARVGRLEGADFRAGPAQR